MAVVKAVCIRGIRSFGPDDGDQQTIVFGRPLTLILGENGCGKTTIIECLRYAVTGQQPPGSRNECFVYDAKVNKTREVLGQAKLKIVNAKGHEITVTRSMQVTSKEKKTQFKTLDGSVERVDEKGRKVEISSRCLDLDHVMQEELGVSKAIINSVIFCHQEDSGWPLDEGKKVKDRFDEIFDSDRYSDCFDRLKKIRKEYSLRIKLLEQEVQHLTEKKTELDKKKLDVVNTESRISDAELKMAALSRDIKPVTEKIKTIERIQMDLVNFESKKESIKTRLQHWQTQQTELKAAIQNIFPGSDEELKLNIENYASVAQSKERVLKGCQGRAEQLSGDEQRTRAEITGNEVKFNKLMLLEGQHQERIDQRNELIVETATTADIKVNEDLESESEAARAVAALAKASGQRRDELERLRGAAEAEESRLQGQVDLSRDAVSRHTQKIVSKQGEVAAARQEVARLEGEVALARDSQQQLQMLQRELEEVEKEYRSTEGEMDTKKCQNEVNEVEKVLEKLEAESDLLNEKIARLQKQSAKLAQKALHEEALSGKEKALAVLRNKHRAALAELLSPVPARGLALAVSAAESAARADVDGMRRRLKDTQHQVTKVQSERTHVRELLKSRQAELTAAEDTLDRACGANTYESTLAKLDATVERLREEQNILQSSVLVINKYKSQLRDNNSCPLCNRGFDSQSEVVQLISELTTKVVNVPAKLEQVSEELSRAAARRDDLVQLKSLSDKIASLRRTEIPHTERRLADLDKQLAEANESAEETSMSLAEPERRLQTAAQLAVDMPLLDRYAQEIEAATKEIRALAEECGTAGGESAEAAGARHAELRRQAATLRASGRTKRAALAAHATRLQDVTQRRTHIGEQLLQLQRKIQEAVSLQESLQQQLSCRERFLLELRALEDAAPRLQLELQGQENTRAALREKNRKELDKRRTQITALENALDKIRALDKEVHQHEEKNVKQEISRLKEANTALLSKKDQIVTEREELLKKIDSLKDELSKQDIYKRELEDNARLRAAAAASDACARELRDAEAAAGGVDRAALAGKEALLRRQTDIFKERAETEGRLKELQQALSSSRLELQRPHNKELENHFRLKFYELQVIRSLDKDVKDYAAAMDKCLMQFHREKMQSINLIIREMWRKIYRGNDIDYIEIKTGNTDTERDRRKFEYRVVQSKNGVEIDMRGRCSAGQKVLACLIIRLALAETFSTRFGVLALDEPTTNLDEANVKSLCRALGDVVLERARQRGFMFIVITHDRDFLESLAAVDKVAHYYEVSRNDDGKSRVKRVKFT